MGDGPTPQERERDRLGCAAESGDPNLNSTFGRRRRAGSENDCRENDHSQLLEKACTSGWLLLAQVKAPAQFGSVYRRDHLVVGRC